MIMVKGMIEFVKNLWRNPFCYPECKH